MTAGPIEVAGRYRLGETLGAGGMGKVWVARDEVLQRDVAVKEILPPPDLLASERDSVHRRTVQEARAAAQLSHPNVAQVYDVIEADGRAFIVMEYVPSRSLHEAIRDDGPMEPRWVAVLGLEILAALEAAHRAGVRHRDVKPANVLLGDDGRVVLTDFGIASIEGDSVITTSKEPVLGSPQYMSPERARDGSNEETSDLWSLGATLYYAVEGRPPYQRGSAMATLTALVSEEPDPPQRAGELRPALDGLLRKDVTERIDTPEARRLLERAAIPPAPPTPEPRSKPKVYAVTGAVTVVVLAAGAVFWVTNRDSSAPSPSAAPSAAAPASAPVVPAPVSSAPAAAVPPSSAPASTAASSAPASSAPASSAPASSAPAKPTSGGLPARPAGWRDYKDPTGFKVYLPASWKRSYKNGMVYFSGNGRTIGVDQTTEPQWDPVADWQGKRDERRAGGDFPGYKEIHIQLVDYFVKAADWEFTYAGSSGRRHINNRGVITSDHQAYGFWFETADSDWAAASEDLQLIFDSFRPKK